MPFFKRKSHSAARGTVTQSAPLPIYVNHEEREQGGVVSRFFFPNPFEDDRKLHKRVQRHIMNTVVGVDPDDYSGVRFESHHMMVRWTRGKHSAIMTHQVAEAVTSILKQEFGWQHDPVIHDLPPLKGSAAATQLDPSSWRVGRRY